MGAAGKRREDELLNEIAALKQQLVKSQQLVSDLNATVAQLDSNILK